MGKYRLNHLNTYFNIIEFILKIKFIKKIILKIYEMTKIYGRKFQNF